jgi:MgsA AAA+ ATPase C terminal
MHFSAQKTPGGYVMGEVRSALQKSIRRGLEREALFWATEIDLAGYGKYLWKTLRVICSEDVGLGEPQLPATIQALYAGWKDVVADEKPKKAPAESLGMIFLAHAVLLLCRARKSRMADNACVVMYSGDRAGLEMQIPDYALDHHTARGRRMGRTEALVYDQSYRVENAADVDDPFAAEAKAIDLAAAAAVSTPNGERRRLLAALHVAYERLNAEHAGDGRGFALGLASKQFGRPITSSAQLSVDEAGWLLEQLTKRKSSRRARTGG